MLQKPKRSTDPALLHALRDYIALVLQTEIELGPEIEEEQVPSFLLDRYWLVAARLLRRPCLLMIEHLEVDETPATIGKHRDLLQRIVPGKLIIFVALSLSAHNRHRLVAQHVPFIIPGNQLFLPDLGMDLREHFRGRAGGSHGSLSPAAQLLVIAFLLGQELEGENATLLGHRFRYTSMSMGRAIDELGSLGLIEIATSGKYRVISATLAKRELWRKARKLLRSPVRKRRQIPRPLGGFNAPLAGETALAERTELARPAIETYAIAASDWKALAKHFNLDRPPDWGELGVELETWSYDPELLASRGLVDPISLWLSLPNSSDERLSMAKGELLKEAGL